MLGVALGVVALVTTPCPPVGLMGAAQQASSAPQELPAWANELLADDRALAVRVRGLLAQERIELVTLISELRLEPNMERDLGFGAAFHSYRSGGGLGVVGVDLIAMQHEGGGTVAEARFWASCCTSVENRRPTEEFRLAVAPAWPGEYDPGGEGGHSSFRAEWKDVKVLAALERRKTRELGVTSRAIVPPELAQDFQLLTSRVRGLTFGDRGGIAGVPLPGRIATNRLIEAKRFDLLRLVLRAWNPAGRVFAAEALLASDEADAKDRHAIERLRAQDIFYCDGGCTTSRENVGDLLDARLGR